jgi:FkbH-like protein
MRVTRGNEQPAETGSASATLERTAELAMQRLVGGDDTHTTPGLGAERDLFACSTPAEFERIARQLRHERPGSTTKLAVLASFSIQFIAPYLVVASHRSGVPVDPWFGPFNQFEQLVLDAQSELWRNAPEVIWLAPRLEDADPDLASHFHQLGPQSAQERLAEFVQRVTGLAGAVRSRSEATLFVSNLCLPQLHSMHIFGASEPSGLKHLIGDANRQLAQNMGALTDTWILDYDGIVTECGTTRWTDPKLHYWARAGISTLGLQMLAARLSRCLAAIKRPAAKCVVVDLDNTLWGGVVGDDGLDALKVSQDYPGNVFRDIQLYLKGLRARGLLLAIASKNDERVALQALDSHPDMVLRSADFAARFINWDPKPTNLRRISEFLNIGLESLVFIDDNPVERARVRAELPMVEVPEMPVEVVQWLRTLQGIERLDRPSLTTEDLRRADMYAADVSRRQLQQSAGTVLEFLGSLGMTAHVGLCDERTLDRIHQLIQKTNQFNLTSPRYAKDEVRRMAEDPHSAVAWLRLEDRYGDMGLVCVGIIRHASDAIWEIDTLLMSCRVMDRQVEDAFLAYLAELAQQRGGTMLKGVYIPTSKNEPVRQFFDTHGFTRDTASPNGNDQSTYVRAIDTNTVAWPAVIQRR